MEPSSLWNGLSARQRLSLSIAVLALVAASVAGGVWLLRDPLVPLVDGLVPERVALLSQALERERIAHRVSDEGRGIAVARSQLGKARAAADGGGVAPPPSVGLEMFKDTDYSATDFAQRINYQRALQGELTRTLQALAGVRSARVHLILPEAGLLRRASTPASAAVGVAMSEGRSLSRAQVRGIQRLVAASVPHLRPADVAVFDESGASLTASQGSEGEASGAQLELKRQVDGYLEGKLARLLDDIVPGGTVGLSVDATLDDRQLRVTTEEPIAAGVAKEGEHPAGVLSRERQIDHGATASSAAETAGAPEHSEWELEYRVGQRVEQTLAMAGSIRRLSVAVAVRGGPPELRSSAIEQLVAHAVGVDRARGDAVTVLLLPAGAREEIATGLLEPAASAPRPLADSARANPAAIAAAAETADRPDLEPRLVASLAGLACAALLLPVAWRRRTRRTDARAAPSSVDADALAVRVRGWLDGEADDAGR